MLANLAEKKDLPMSAPLLPRAGWHTSRLAARLKGAVAGEVLFDAASRGRYATDASIYQITPIGVVVPRVIADVEAALAIAREAGIPVLPRGAGTSQAGQTVNEALVLDCSKYLRNVVAVDPQAGTATVEPGLVLGHLNAALRRHGLFFPVDPSTHARCTIGGMAGNNSCGAKSIRYGLMADNVLAIDAILADGSRHRFDEATTEPAALIARLRALGATEAEEITARFPRQLRRVGGYNIDALTPGAARAGRGNFARLLVGSEGTLAFSANLTLKLAPIKPRKILGICQFPNFRAAMAATSALVTLDPEAVELVDRTMIDLGRSITIYQPTIERMAWAGTDSLLIVEFHGELDMPLLEKLADLETLMADLGYPGGVVRATDAAFQNAIAEVREAGLNIMMSMKGDAKPVSFIEDTAVDLTDLADYTEQINAIFEKNGTRGTWYAHASVGCLHVRPVLSMKDAGDIKRMRMIAEECFSLVRSYNGSHSGEHGDGIVRSEFHKEMFGARIVRAFEVVKDGFDPTGLFNPGRIVRAPRMDDRSLFRYPPDYHADPGFTPRLDWSDHPGGLLGAAEMCNNNGTCRRFDAGAMCPSYRVTRDEMHLTRGRANTLRLALSGQLGVAAMASDTVAEALALCVSCKACKRECPTGVDMARMKIEVLAARAARHGLKPRERLIAALPRLARLASPVAPLANAAIRMPGLAALLSLAPGRSLPAFRRDKFDDSEIPDLVAGMPVLLFGDTFNRYFEPENLRAAIRVLAACGFAPRAPQACGQLCCGRTLLAAGQIDRARAEAARVVAACTGDLPVVGLEPSCLLTLRDEFPALLPGAATRDLARRALLLPELLARAGVPPDFDGLAATAHVHGHCHQKAHGAWDATLSALARIPELKLVPITSSCCGMAGAFGYQAETAGISRAMAEASLLPTVRAADMSDIIVADGTSCRHQIRDLAGREAVHSVQILDRALPSRNQQIFGRI